MKLSARQRLIENLAGRLAIGLRRGDFKVDDVNLRLEQLADSEEFSVSVDAFRWDRLARDVRIRLAEKYPCDKWGNTL